MPHTLRQNRQEGTARFRLTVVLAAVGSFVFTIFAEMLTMASTRPLTALHIHPEFPVITICVGILVGLIERNRTAIAAMLSFVPWSVFMVVGVNAAHSSASRWLITLVVVATYVAVGIGAAMLTAKTLRRLSQREVSV